MCPLSGLQYLDNGASHWRVTNNVASNSSLAWAFFMTGGGGQRLPAQNITVDHLWWVPGRWQSCTRGL